MAAKKEIDAFLSELNSGTGDSYVITENPNKITTEYISTSAKPRNMPPPTDEDFIDDLLG